MRSVTIEKCSRCGVETNYYDPNAGRICPSCEWEFIWGSKIGFEFLRSRRWFEREQAIREDDGSCVLGKNKDEWLKNEPNVKTFTEVKFGMYVINGSIFP